MSFSIIVLMLPLRTALALAAALAVAGCGAGASGSPDTRPTVVATTTQAADLARNVAGDRAEVVARGTFRPANLSVALGAEVTWRFPERHNVLLAEGPRAVVSGTRTGGDSWSKRFDTPGEYRLFCWLHPVTMQQVVRVRDRG